VKRWRPTYSLLDVMRASAELPMPAEKSRHQLTRMHEGLLAIETAPDPKLDDWRVVADAVTLMETLEAMGCIVDGMGLIPDAVEALAIAGARAQEEGKPIRLQGRGIEAVRGVLEDYTEALEGLPERVIVDAHRRTEQRMHAILTGRPQAHDKLVVHA
jgi:uncharacterized protein YyaL (SSP411 family)